MHPKLLIPLTFGLISTGFAATADAGLEDVVADSVFSGLENPVWVTSEPDGGLSVTDVRTTLRVLDTATGEERVYNRALGVSYDPVRDTAAFSGCP